MNVTARKSFKYSFTDDIFKDAQNSDTDTDGRYPTFINMYEDVQIRSRKATPNKIFSESVTNRTNECVPMEIDESLHTENEEDISSKSLLDYYVNKYADETADQSCQSSNLEDTVVETKTRQCSTYILCTIGLLLINLILLIALILVYYNNNNPKISSSDNLFQIESLHKHLKENLHGQNNVIDDLIKLLLNIDENRFNFFIGGIGVGKTYTVDIIQKYFVNKKQIFRIIYGTDIITDRRLQGLSKVNYNLVILDGLKLINLDDLVELIDKIYFGKFPIILFVLVTTNESKEQFESDLSRLFNSTEHFNIIKFNDLSDDVVKKCIIKSLEKHQIETSVENVEKVFKSLGDITGCKRVDSKVAILNTS